MFEMHEIVGMSYLLSVYVRADFRLKCERHGILGEAFRFCGFLSPDYSGFPSLDSRLSIP
jgi:hypothetical protein